MTVAELIDKLREMPQDAQVLVHKNCGCCDWMPGADTVTFKRAGEKNDAYDVEEKDFVEIINDAS